MIGIDLSTYQMYVPVIFYVSDCVVSSLYPFLGL